jgi:hypothetical protein
MKNFELCDIDDKNKLALVYSLNYLRLEEYQDDVALSLRAADFIGWVRFDLLLSNGYAFNRYVELYFDGVNFDTKTTRVYQAKETDIISSLNFYSAPGNLDYLENSILSKSQKFLIKKRYIQC